MPALNAKLIEVFQLGDEFGGVLDLPESAWPEPGQYIPSQRQSADPEVLTTPLFRFPGEADRLSVGPLPAGWLPGLVLDILPPHGHGFVIPISTHRIGLMVLDGSPSRLLPLIPPALEKRAAVALFCDEPLPRDLRDRIPSAVEIAPLSALTDDLTWPDFLAVDLPRESLTRLREVFGTTHLPFKGQALIKTAMPCHGLGKCGVCAVKTSRGWKLACEDGPVFALEEVLHVAG